MSSVGSPKAPDVPLPIQSNQRLSFLQFCATSGAIIRINIFRASRLLQDFLMLLLCSGFRWTSVLLRYRFLLDLISTAYTLFAKDLFPGVGNLSINRQC